MSYGFRNLQLKMLSNGDACTVFAQYEALTSDDKYLQTESENFLKYTIKYLKNKTVSG